ncbi:PREDICTED: replication protein A 70 kDa DNA-binding subunit D-like [Ipomoea nil]|uniref:replication protein A 70 kDa DNA-binding subunit D-like n=1 Tax=Ipomoea nil TaxID=35883 RepID=UPI000901E746|nr:PREDICTED: replication protein A 70 kDa DNA-binding subunit D-like [Ipomoea nil]
MVKEYKNVSFPNKTFRLKSISSLVRKDDIDEKMRIDVIGRVTEIYFPVERVVAGQRARLIDFVLEDINQDQIQCTLWGDHVNSLLPIYSSTVTEEPMEMCTYQLHLMQQKFGSIRKMPDFEEFKKSLSLSSGRTPLRKLDSSSRLPGFRSNRNSLSDDIVVTSLSEIYHRKEYWVAVRIMDVDSSDGWYYMSCKGTNCGKKITPREGLMYCSKCDRSWHEGAVKYKVVVRVTDSTCEAPTSTKMDIEDSHLATVVIRTVVYS